MIDYKEIIKKIEPEMAKSINYLEKELQKLHVSRVSPALIENLEVECFGQKFLLKRLAAISVGEKRELIVQPWDKSYLKSIEKAILNNRLVKIKKNIVIDRIKKRIEVSK